MTATLTLRGVAGGRFAIVGSLRPAPVRSRSRKVLRDVEAECSAVRREKDVLSHHAFEGFSIDARHDRRLKILPRRPDPFPFVKGPSHGHAPCPDRYA